MSQKTFVLVHGAWGGSYNWFPILPGLKAAGHDVFFASNSGHGERRHLSNPNITLETHILDTVNLILHHDLQNITLVGHSYGGMIITGVWDRLRDRIHHVVYLDAFVPKDGKSLDDYAPADRKKERKRTAQENGGMVPYMVAVGGQPADPRSTAQSELTFSTPLYYKNGSLPKDTHKTYVLAIENKPSPFFQFGEKVKRDPSWNYFEIDSGHNIMLEKPDWTVSLLNSLA